MWSVELVGASGLSESRMPTVNGRSGTSVLTGAGVHRCPAPKLSGDYRGRFHRPRLSPGDNKKLCTFPYTALIKSIATHSVYILFDRLEKKPQNPYNNS